MFGRQGLLLRLRGSGLSGGASDYDANPGYGGSEDRYGVSFRCVPNRTESCAANLHHEILPQREWWKLQGGGYV